MGRTIPWTALLILPVILPAALAGCARQSCPRAPAHAASAAPRARPITAREIRAHLEFLADDRLEGRGLGSAGLELAARYHVAVFRALGLEPAFGSSYLQPFTVRGSRPDPEASLAILGAGAPRAPTYGEQFVVVSHREDGPAAVEGELVYGGYLIQAPERGWDDVKGADLKGKVLLVEVNEPGNRPEGIFDGPAMTYYGRWTYKFARASALGALGILLVHDTGRAAYGWDVVRSSWTGEDFFLPGHGARTAFQGWLHGDVVRQALEAAGHDHGALLARAERKDFRPVPLGLRVRVTQRPRFRTVTTANVAGVLRARHPRPRDRAVVLSAHYDHLGQDPSLEGDRIFNGAVDNCAASAAMLAATRRLAAHPERLQADVLVLAASAEEAGLLGSTHFAHHLPRGVGPVVANINFEMTNVWGETRDLYAIGASHSTLDAVCRRAAEQIGAAYIAEQDRENGFFFRSDQLSFARVGIPAVWLHEGITSRGADPGHIRAMRAAYRAKHYHRPSDDVAHLARTWDLAGAVQIARWGEAIVRLVAAADAAPRFGASSAFGRAAGSAQGARQGESSGPQVPPEQRRD